MTDEKIDETTIQMLTENGDKEDGTLNNSVSDGEIIEDDELEESKSPFVSLTKKVPKNFRSRNGNSDSEDDTVGPGGKSEVDINKTTDRPNGKQPMSRRDLERLRKERKDIINELGRRDESNDRKSTHARHSFDGNRPPRNNYPRSGFRRSFNDQNSRNNFRDRQQNARGNFHRANENGNSRQPNPDEFRVNGVHGTIFIPKSIIKYTKATPSLAYSENPSPRERKKFEPNLNRQRETQKKDGERRRRNRTRSRERDRKKPSRSERKQKESPSKKLREIRKTSPEKQISSKSVDQDDDKSKEVKEENEKKEEIKTETRVSIENVVIKQKSHSPEKIIEEKCPEELVTLDEREVSPSPETLSKEIDSIFENSRFAKIEIKIEKRKSPKRLEKPKVNIFLEDSDEVDEFEKVSTFEVPSKWSSPPRLKKENSVCKILEPLVSLPTEETNKFNHPAIPEVVESPERSPIPSPVDNVFTIAKSPTPPPKPNPHVRNVCSFLSDIASGNFFSDFLSDNAGACGLNIQPYKTDDSPVEPDTTVAKSSDQNSDIDDDSDASDSDDSDSSDTSSSSDSDTTSSSESEEESEDSDDGIEIPTFSGFGTFNSSSMPMVQQIKPMSAPLTPASSTSTVSPQIPAKIGPFSKPPNLYTPSPIKSLQSNPIPFVMPAFNANIPGMQIPFKIYSLRDTANIFTPPTTPISTPVISTPSSDKSERKTDDREKSERRDKDRKRSRSRSLSRERDRKRIKDDKRKSPQRRKSPSPIRKRHEDRKDTRRREDDRRRDSHRSSPIRKRKSRSRSPQRARSKSPQRPRTPPQRNRRSPQPPTRRSLSRSPPAKFRRSCSPGARRMRSPSPNYRRSPRRQRHHSRSPNRKRRSPSPNHRYDRRSYSPTFRNKMESPSGYKPDSTISDTELERQQQQQQMHDDYYGQWSNQNSPKRPNLDDRIHNIMTDSPSQQQQKYLGYQEVYSYENPMFDSNMYGMYDEYGNYAPQRNFVNNSNLVEITQQKRDRQRVESSQVAVQVGNVLQILPSKVITTPETERPKTISSDEKRAQSKAKRKIIRERKRQEKVIRKEKLRQEIQKYFDVGITADQSDNEDLVPLRSVNISAVAEKSILKKLKPESKSERKVLFKDGILPGESTTDEEMSENHPNSQTNRQKRKKFRKKRLQSLLKGQRINGKMEIDDVSNEIDADKSSHPAPPIDLPPNNLMQPRLKKITPEMFAAFPVNPEPMYYYIERIKQAQQAQSNGYHPQPVPPPRGPNERFSYYKKPPPIGHSPSFTTQHLQSPSSIIQNVQQQLNQKNRKILTQRPSQPSSVSSLDPRINQQRLAEKTFA